MNKEKIEIRTDTVSSGDGSNRVILRLDKSSRAFDYTHLCKNIIKQKKRWVDANFLVSLKLLKEYEDVQEETFYNLLVKWMDAFKNKIGNIDYFWIYLVYMNGYNKFKGLSEDADMKECIDDCVIKDAKTYMNDVSKLEKNKYITKLCESGDTNECWILRVYEIILKKTYLKAEMTLLVQRIISYLKECEIRINYPVVIEHIQDENVIYSVASMLMLLVMRLRLNIDIDWALRKYKSGNVAYSGYRDQMLAEYIQLSSLYFYQSYERLIQMQYCAEHCKNKYAAKEVGDIYRLGMELQDIHGNIVVVEADGETACEYYRICIDAEYIPAYVPAVKTGVLLSEEQKAKILETAKVEKNPECLAYYAEKWIEEADTSEIAESSRVLKLIKQAVDAMTFMEDNYGEKHVLKNALLQSKTFTAYKSGELGQEKELNEMLRHLFSKDVIGMDENAILMEIGETYKLAGKYGFYEAEYRLGKLFQGSKADISNKYFEQGKEKGCIWCTLECAQIQREQVPKEWLRTMLKLGRRIYKDITLKIRVAEEWVAGDDVLKQIVEGKIKLQINEIMEIYLQIRDLVSCIFKKNDNDGNDNDEIKENVKLLAELVKQQEYLEDFILKDQKRDKT